MLFGHAVLSAEGQPKPSFFMPIRKQRKRHSAPAWCSCRLGLAAIRSILGNRLPMFDLKVPRSCLPADWQWLWVLSWGLHSCSVKGRAERCMVLSLLCLALRSK